MDQRTVWHWGLPPPPTQVKKKLKIDIQICMIDMCLFLKGIDDQVLRQRGHCTEDLAVCTFLDHCLASSPPLLPLFQFVSSSFFIMLNCVSFSTTDFQFKWRQSALYLEFLVVLSWSFHFVLVTDCDDPFTVQLPPEDIQQQQTWRSFASDLHSYNWSMSCTTPSASKSDFRFCFN